MKTVGLIGGLSWESTQEYYRILNQEVKARLGGLHSAKCLLFSFDFEEIESLQHKGKWEGATQLMVRAAQSLEKAGADGLLICSNTMHKSADAISNQTHIPLLHIADVTGKAILKQGLKHVGLLGTKFTMEQDFYRTRLAEKFDLNVSIPDEPDRELVHEVIFSELCLGKVLEASRKRFCTIVEKLAEKGAQGIILGCTEIGLLLGPGDVKVPLFDTTPLHAKAAIDWALEEGH